MGKILVVDDDPAVITLLASGLGKKHSVLPAETGKCALELFASEKPELIFLDINMPDISGLELLKSFSSAKPKPVIIMLTGVDTLDTAKTALENGAAEYVTKPFSLKLVRTIAEDRLSALNRKGCEFKAPWHHSAKSHAHNKA